MIFGARPDHGSQVKRALSSVNSEQAEVVGDLLHRSSSSAIYSTLPTRSDRNAIECSDPQRSRLDGRWIGNYGLMLYTILIILAVVALLVYIFGRRRV